LNKLTQAGVYVADQLFATLDPTTRRVDLPGGHVTLFTDTVGFIQKLPTDLIAAFRATLEEIAESDLLLHVVDITHANARQQAEAVLQTLADIEADHIPILTALNKVDKLSDPQKAFEIIEQFPNSIGISALTGDGIDHLLNKVNQNLYENFVSINVKIPLRKGALIALYHEQGVIEEITYGHGFVFIQGKIPGRHLASYRPYIANQSDDA
jgi:GTP-binding protein HflX